MTTDEQLNRIRGEIYGLVLVVSRNAAFSCRSEQEAQEVRQQIKIALDHLKGDDDPFGKGIASSLADVLDVFESFLKPEPESVVNQSVQR